MLVRGVSTVNGLRYGQSSLISFEHGMLSVQWWLWRLFFVLIGSGIWFDALPPDEKERPEPFHGTGYPSMKMRRARACCYPGGPGRIATVRVELCVSAWG